MILDIRVWSFFMWLIATCLYVAGFATPYELLGSGNEEYNRPPIIVAFGGDVIPKGTRIGLWKEVPLEISGPVNGCRAVLSIGLVAIVVSLVCYVLICKHNNTVINMIAFSSQLLAGLFALIGIGIFRSAVDELGEGFWMVVAAGGLYIINSLVLVFMPLVEYEVPKWHKAPTKDIPLTNVAKA